MTRSMTGFGSATRRFQLSQCELELAVEIKTLNSKYLDLSFRCPRIYAAWESRLTKMMQQQLTRGRVEVTVTRKVLSGHTSRLRVNQDQLKACADVLQNVRQSLGLSEELKLSDLLNFPGWFEVEDSVSSQEEEWPLVEQVVAEALQQLMTVREAEGRGLKEALLGFRDELRQQLSFFGEARDRLSQELRQRWRERLGELAQDQILDPTRVEQELVYWAGKSDYSEEWQRLEHHLSRFDELLGAEGERGRRLEFLAQEMQREVNTLASKCPDARLMGRVIELKSSVEKIREQALNVE